MNLEQLLQRQGLLFKDLKRFVLQHSDRIKDHARATGRGECTSL